MTKLEHIFQTARDDLGPLSKRDRFIAGVILYAGEGDKTDGKGGFSNSNPGIIRFMMGWFQEYCSIPISRMRGAIWLHEGLDEVKSKSFWSNITNIPMSQFHKTYITKRKEDSKKVRKNLHDYGVFSIRFSDSDKQRKILGWISAVLNDRIPEVH